MSMTTDRHWRKSGETDPYFGVVSFPEFKADRIAENADHFFETGRREIAIVLDKLKRLYGDVPTSRALDFGSDVGRLVLPLSERFDHVVGVDISDAMIAEARKNCAKAGVHNVEFVMSDDALSAVTGPVRSRSELHCYSAYPGRLGLAVTARLLSLLSPGGSAALHYSIQRTLTPAKALAYAIKHKIPVGRNVMNLLQGREWDAPAMQMNNYPLTEIIRIFEKNGLEQIVIVPEWHSSALSARVYGRKAQAR